MMTSIVRKMPCAMIQFLISANSSSMGMVSIVTVEFPYPDGSFLGFFAQLDREIRRVNCQLAR